VPDSKDAAIAMKRRKTSFEKWFSFNRHRRRFGAAAVAAQQSEDWQALKDALVPGGPQGGEPSYAHGASTDLSEHLRRLQGEFAGQPQLLYQHAQLIVLIRREADVAGNYQRLERMWLAETDFLRTRLDLRWLVAACDTFIDHAADPVLRAVAMNGPLLVNTIKLQETERYLQAAHGLSDRPDALQALHSHRVGLFDGLTAFIAGTDDTLRNMRWRLGDVCALHPLGALVLEIFDRLQRAGNDNVYLRFRQRHTRERTRWWDGD